MANSFSMYITSKATIECRRITLKHLISLVFREYSSGYLFFEKSLVRTLKIEGEIFLHPPDDHASLKLYEILVRSSARTNLDKCDIHIRELIVHTKGCSFTF